MPDTLPLGKVKAKEVCNKRFDRADQLQRHLKLHPTSNLLSCNLCHFQASNVEALNHHLKESHTLQTYNTRSRFGTQLDGDQRYERSQPGDGSDAQD
nr:hypothetical protein BaRGS_015138 [Batillaria attramentaria]